MPKIITGLTDAQRRVHFFISLLFILSLSIIGVNFLAVGGMSVFYLHRLFMLFLILSLGFILFTRYEISLDQLDLAILAFFSVIIGRFALDLLGSYPVTQSLTITVQLALAVSFFFAFASLPVDGQRLRILLRVWLLIVLVLTVYGFYQTLARNLGLPLANITIGAFTTQEANLFGFQRPTSLFREPTHFGAFVLPSYVFLTYIYLKREDSKILFDRRVINTLIIVGMWITFFFIASLGGYIALIGTIALATILNRNFRRKTIKIAGLGVVLFFGVLLFGQNIDLLYAPVYRVAHFVTSLVGLIFSGETVSGSIGERLTRLYWATSVGLQNPLFGVGINNIRYLELVVPSWLEGNSLDPITHSEVGFVLSSAGLLGLLTYGAIYATVIRYIYAAKSRFEHGFNQAAITAIGYAIFANAVTGFFSLPVIHPLKWYLFGIASILFTYSTTEKVL